MTQQIKAQHWILIALGLALTPFIQSSFGLVLTIGLLTAIGAAARRITVEQRGTTAGVINAGGSFGQFVFAPIAQHGDYLWMWYADALLAAAAALFNLPIQEAKIQRIVAAAA